MFDFWFVDIWGAVVIPDTSVFLKNNLLRRKTSRVHFLMRRYEFLCQAAVQRNFGPGVLCLLVLSCCVTQVSCTTCCYTTQVLYTSLKLQIQVGFNELCFRPSEKRKDSSSSDGDEENQNSMDVGKPFISGLSIGTEFFEIPPMGGNNSGLYNTIVLALASLRQFNFRVAIINFRNCVYSILFLLFWNSGNRAKT